MEELKKVIGDPRVTIEYIEEPKESIVAPFDTELFRIMERENLQRKVGRVLRHVDAVGRENHGAHLVTLISCSLRLRGPAPRARSPTSSLAPTG